MGCGYAVLIVSEAVDATKLFLLFYTCHSTMFFAFIFAVFLPTHRAEIQTLPVLNANGRCVGILFPVSILAPGV